MRGADCGAWTVDCGRSFTFRGASSSTAAESRRCTCHASFMNGCFDSQLSAVVFDGVKTSRMLSCQAVTIRLQKGRVLEHRVRGLSRSLKMSPFDTAHDLTSI